MFGTDAAPRARLTTAAVAALAGAAAVAGSYAAAGFAPAFVVAPIERFLARTVPGFVITVAITALGNLGQKLNLLFAAGLAVAAFGALALGAITAARALAARSGGATALPAALGLTGVAAWGLAALVTRAPRAAIGAALGAAAVVGLAEAVRLLDGGRATDGRREVLASLAGFATLGVAGVALGERRSSAPAPVESDGTEGSEDGGDASAVGSLLAEAAEKSLDVPGMEPLVSEKFYQVDINAVDPTIEREEWSLTVTGAVDREVTVDFADLVARPAREEFVTLRCVGEDLNGRKMDTALWTVTDVMPLLEEAGTPEECCVMLRAEDGYFEEFPLAALEDAMLAYRMNGKPLPRGHGHPVRALVPGHWGEINVKWLTEIEVLEEPADGYWEKRGWHGTGPVNTVAKLHAVNREDGRIQVGGHAYAGTRGVSAVEVSTDGGETWAEATLSAPLPGEDVWRQWAFEYEAPGREHEVVVRAVEADGTVQSAERTGSFPRGASGWVSRTITP